MMPGMALSRAIGQSTRFIGILVHGAILVPYRGWQRSHALHHMKTGHFREEEVFRPAGKGEDTLFRKLIFRSGIFVIIGWPMYKLGIRNLTTYKPITGSHYLPQSDLYTTSVRVSWYLGLLSLFGVFSALYQPRRHLWLGLFRQIHSRPLSDLWCLADLRHLYAARRSQRCRSMTPKDWTRLKGALASVDRNYGPFNWLTHNIGNLHVIHHIFPTIPHYRLQEATNAIKPILGAHYRQTNSFVLTDFISSQLRCHYVVPDEGFERYESAYGWLKPQSKPLTGKPEPQN